MYAVVEFMDSAGASSNELAVVPLQWLHKEEKKCYWPINIRNTTLKKFVQNQTPYKKNWPTYEVYRIHSKTMTYISAEEKLLKLIESNNEKTESSHNTTISYTLKSFEENSSEESDTDPHNTLIIKKPHLSVHNNMDSHIPLHKSQDIIPTPRDTASEISSNPSTPHSTPSTSRSSISNNCYEEQVLAKLTRLEAEIGNHSLILNELVRTNRKINVEKLVAPSGLPIFPITSTDIFDEFEESLKNESVSDYMVRRLAAVGGSNIQAQTRRILYFLLTDEVAIRFNWKGRDKLSFEKTLSMKVIYEAAKRNFPSEEKSDFNIAQAVKEWLKFAKARINSRKKK